MITLNQHPLLLQAYELMVEVDKLPAHPEQTALISDLGDWRNKLTSHLEKHGLLAPKPMSDDKSEDLTVFQCKLDKSKCEHEWNNEGCNPTHCLKCGQSFIAYAFMEAP